MHVCWLLTTIKKIQILCFSIEDDDKSVCPITHVIPTYIAAFTIAAGTTGARACRNHWGMCACRNHWGTCLQEPLRHVPAGTTGARARVIRFNPTQYVTRFKMTRIIAQYKELGS